MHQSLQRRLDEVSTDMKLQGQVFAEKVEERERLMKNCKVINMKLPSKFRDKWQSKIKRGVRTSELIII